MSRVRIGAAGRVNSMTIGLRFESQLQTAMCRRSPSVTAPCTTASNIAAIFALKESALRSLSSDGSCGVVAADFQNALGIRTRVFELNQACMPRA
ncbi:hypothetical protein LMG28614_00991 [Paraburkholderia ultramafica]|uniref:Uncharacterized protein n=1 Tax=Paraburkholderia ultramafica TaxID=1544867 RepID=A0A6S7CHB6_9BURK|nr:hypothetical protein LMG28614_00991 [Paraburkholderia ultramafica]